LLIDLTPPIQNHNTDYWQKLLKNYASHFQPKKEPLSKKRERGSDVPNKQANKRHHKEKDSQQNEVQLIQAISFVKAMEKCEKLANIFVIASEGFIRHSPK
jgi:hypothetical protein